VDDKQLMLRLKELLFQFHLAYPAGKGGLTWDSDLIVPTYWKKRKPHQASSSKAPDVATLTHFGCWEYEFKEHLPETLFQRFGVQSYSVHFSSKRIFTRNSFDSISAGQYHAQVVKKFPHDSEEERATRAVATMRIRVLAASRKVLWPQLILHVMNLEKLLDGYPGLLVTRRVVSRDDNRYDLDDLLAVTNRNRLVAAQIGMKSNLSRELKQLLPNKMDWYTQKKWRLTVGQSRPGFVDGTKTDKQMLACLKEMKENVIACVESSKDAILTHIDTFGNRRDYPALWTLEYREDRAAMSKVILRMRSHLSGKCFHDPIEIKVPPKFFGKHGVAIKVGASLIQGGWIQRWTNSAFGWCGRLGCHCLQTLFRLKSGVELWRRS
jgi:hypothetical protein